jgi:putative addiction module killer protein
MENREIFKKAEEFLLTNRILRDTIKPTVEVRETQAFTKWLKKLRDKKGVAIITARIRRLSFGNFGDTGAVGENIGELRIDYGPGYRVYFAQKKKQLVILLGGGDKSTQSKDIKKAKKLAQALEAAT